jgi:Trimerisation motif/Phosphate-selective porin O and P
MKGTTRFLALVSLGMTFLLSIPTVMGQETKQAGANAEVAKAEAPGSGSAPAPAPTGAPSAEEVNELKEEMKQLRVLVQEQQAQLEKLKGPAPSTEAAAPPAASTPTPTLAPQAGQDTVEEQPIRPFKIGGFANWAYGKTSNANEYDLATQHGRFDNIDMGLILTLGLTSNVNATAQVSFQAADDHTETDVDFAFLDWRVNDKLNVHAGQVKNPFGLYSEFFGIGTIYPFNDVPQSIYGGTAIGNEFYRGVGISGRAFATRKWEASYDFFFGSLLNDELNPGEQISDAILSGQSTVAIADSSEPIRQAFGGRLTLARPDNGLRFGINGNTGISPDRGRHSVVGAFAAYDTAKWLLRSEYGDAFEPGFIHFSGAYVEAGYKIDRHWQPLFRYDWARQGLVTSAVIPDTFKSHREIGGGLDYWVNPKAVLKFAYHHVDGNLLAVPRADLDLANLTVVPKTTNLATFGMAFVF